MARLPDNEDVGVFFGSITLGEEATVEKPGFLLVAKIPQSSPTCYIILDIST
jgi:hypothetical protein